MRILRGMAVSPGIAYGKVRILQNPEDSHHFEQGNILVTFHTSPLHLPAMLKASALVTDKGGVTCHAAVIARELNIPAVVGTERATSELRDGMVIVVDGTKGEVRYEE